jgi:uncharacterized protein
VLGHVPRSRVVLDTNIIISSLWPGPPRRVVNLWRDGEFLAVVSEPILQEYVDVLRRFPSVPENIEDFVALFTDPMRTILAVPRIRLRVVEADPSDDKFLECAVAGHAEFIVSGDKHLKSLQRYRHIPILSPADFLDNRSR